jgi:hypothetical protein
LLQDWIERSLFFLQPLDRRQAQRASTMRTSAIVSS